MLVFLQNMLGMLPVMGVHAFEQVAPSAAAELIGNGVLTRVAEEGAGDYRFAQDYVFTSPSTAAVVLGPSANGRVEWKDATGRTLKELQEREAAA